METEQQLEAMRRMLRIRRFEEAAMNIVRKGQGIPGAVHICIGQEAAIVGACLAVRDDDYMVGYHRSHGHPIAKGAELGPLMAELMGRSTGHLPGQGRVDAPGRLPCRQPRRDGDRRRRHPAGRGRGLQRHGSAAPTRSRCASSATAPPTSASFHEGLNLASMWDLGVVFVCENNLYADVDVARATRWRPTRSRPAPPPTGCRASSSTVRTSWRCSTRSSHGGRAGTLPGEGPR